MIEGALFGGDWKHATAFLIGSEVGGCVLVIGSSALLVALSESVFADR